jgi:HEAT repeat protein
MRSEDPLAVWIADLEHTDKRTVRRAVDALTAAAGASNAVAAALTSLLDDPERKNRWALAYILAQLPYPPGAAMAALFDGLDHRDADIRWAIALLLVRLARVDRPIVESLLRLCMAGTPTQRRLAVYCVRDLNLQDAASREAVLQALRDSDPLVRIAAAGSLKRTAGLHRESDDMLLEVFLNDPDARVRSVAAITLAQRGFSSEVFFQALERAGNGENAEVVRAARAALELLRNG